MYKNLVTYDYFLFVDLRERKKILECVPFILLILLIGLIIALSPKKS